MKRVPTKDVKNRTRQLTEFFHSYEPYKNRTGARYQILVTDIAHDKQHFVGHNEFYEQVRAFQLNGIIFFCKKCATLHTYGLCWPR